MLLDHCYCSTAYQTRLVMGLFCWFSCRPEFLSICFRDQFICFQDGLFHYIIMIALIKWETWIYLFAFPTDSLCNSKVQFSFGHFKLIAIFSKCRQYLSTSVSWNLGASRICFDGSKCFWEPDESPSLSNFSYSSFYFHFLFFQFLFNLEGFFPSFGVFVPQFGVFPSFHVPQLGDFSSQVAFSIPFL